MLRNGCFLNFRMLYLDYRKRPAQRIGGQVMLIVGNGRMITRDVSCPFLEDGAVVMDKNKIIEVGQTEDIRKAYKEAEYIDAKKGVIMPAFINTHEHIYSARPEDFPLTDTIRKAF